MRSDERFMVLGYEFTVATRSGVARRLLHRLYAGCDERVGQERVPCFELTGNQTAQRLVWRVSLDDCCLATRSTLSAALQQLEYEICTRIIAHRTDLIALHGAVAASPRGAAFIAGPSGSGKTTLALALVTRDFRVAGDDVALLDPSSGMLWPVPRCAHLDDSSRSLLRGIGLQLPAAAVRHEFVTPADLGTCSQTAVPVQHVLLLSRGGDAHPTVSTVASAEALVCVLAEAGWHGPPSSAVLATFGAFVGDRTCHRVASGSLAATVDAVAALIAR
jgi:hypothetical protein